MSSKLEIAMNEAYKQAGENAYFGTGFKMGAEYVKKEYEEKLHWIPIEEKLPENDIRVLTKFKNGKVIVNSYDTHMDKWQYEFDVEYTHWRSIL